MIMKCSFCGGKVADNSGKIFVKKSGQILYFCNSKCQKNQKMGRLGKKTRWTETFKSLKKK